jgi:ribose 5-phosphate isomerase A
VTTSVSELKKQAAQHAVRWIEPGMVVGLGHGSTALEAIRYIAVRLAQGEIRDIVGVPCSREMGEEAQRLGIPLGTLQDYPVVDLTIDGADEADDRLNLIKGGGGALVREKIVAQATRREVIVVDETKISPVLGTNFKLPVECVPFGWTSQAAYLESLGASLALRREPGGQPLVTDQGNYILDCDFGPIHEPANLGEQIKGRTGIVDHGLFLGLATDLVIAGQDGIRHLTVASNSP